jgi:murein DD-endopeptidase MepM/ murein hydrolase activator NlpD
LPNGRTVTTFKNVTVTEGPYGLENIQLDDERGQLLDADLIRIEAEKLRNIWSQVTLQPRWEGLFRYPVAIDTLRITSNYGTRRTYNDSEELSFHGGTDFGGGAGAPIFAPAAGTVALAEPLTVRGNAVVIDHGMGLYSNYWHQSQTVVTVGQTLQPGDLIGYIGSTGLVTGPHLHWELRLHGVAVDPLQWVQETIP